MSTKLESGQFSIQVPDPPGGVRTDTSEWPVVVVIPPTHQMTDADYRAYLEWTRKHIVTSGQIYAMVLDSRHCPPITPSQRKILGEHIQISKPYTSKHCAGVAMIFESAVMRGVMTAIFWMTSPEYPTRVFGNVAEGVSWCKAQLKGFTGNKEGLRAGG